MEVLCILVNSIFPLFISIKSEEWFLTVFGVYVWEFVCLFWAFFGLFFFLKRGMVF